MWARLHPGTIETLEHLESATDEAPRLVVRSERVMDDAESAFASWSGAGWRAFDEAIARLATVRGTVPVIWPGPGSVLSDAVSTLGFLRKRTGVRLLADPVAWITEAMAKDAPDHLHRFAQALMACEDGAIEGVVLRGCPAAGLPAVGGMGEKEIGGGGVGQILRPLIERVGTVAGSEADLSRF